MFHRHHLKIKTKPQNQEPSGRTHALVVHRRTLRQFGEYGVLISRGDVGEMSQPFLVLGFLGTHRHLMLQWCMAPPTPWRLNWCAK